MTSVTRRISQIKQPRGGYVRPRDFEVVNLEDTENLHENENIHATLIGLAVDYLTRFMNGTSIEKAFDISMRGALLLGKETMSNKLMATIRGLDDDSIESACKLVGFDVVVRSGRMGYRPVEDITPNVETISNIRSMVNRGLTFFTQYGPVVKDGFTFAGGYTSTISSGDGDFLTKDTLWDVKVSKSAPKTQHTLQLLVYYLIGIRSIHKEFNTIEHLGIYNPRLNKLYVHPIHIISEDIIEEVNTTVIGY